VKKDRRHPSPTKRKYPRRSHTNIAKRKRTKVKTSKEQKKNKGPRIVGEANHHAADAGEGLKKRDEKLYIYTKERREGQKTKTPHGVKPGVFRGRARKETVAAGGLCDAKESIHRYAGELRSENLAES